MQRCERSLHATPIVRIDLLAGCPPEAKATPIVRVTEVVADTLDVCPEQVRVLLSEVSPEHRGIGGVSVAAREQPTTTAEAEQ